ncbi:MAG: TlpA family protein disulfide reductase [Pirellulaceae bacterium]|nr:TlpA family protein disulfide reductase [Pirellulaceae bacterium]
MLRYASRLVVLAVCGLAASLAGISQGATQGTVLYNNRTVTLDLALDTEQALWLTPAQVTEVTGYVLKPEGLCSDQKCILIRRDLDAELLQIKDDMELLNLTQLARSLTQPVVVDIQRRIWSFGSIGSPRTAAESPDFELPNRQGQLIKLSDFRGKKVLLLSWASWCRCRGDLTGWEAIYQELRDQNFEIIAVAQDTQGEVACGKYYDQAKASYTTLIDRQHVVSSLFQMVNVPMGVWIDEAGRIVRPAEVAYSRPVALLNIKVDGGSYVQGLRDWVKQGDRSPYALSTAEIGRRLMSEDDRYGLAEANFKLAVHLQLAGDAGSAEYFKAAQSLAPDNWNYHRQHWAFQPESADRMWFKKLSELKGRPYYAPLDLPAVADAQSGNSQ